MNRYLELSYWFNAYPGSVNLAFWRGIFVAAGAAVLIALVALAMMRKYREDGLRRRPWAKLAVWGFTIAPVGLLIAFFRFQNAYFLSMRIFFLLWIVGSLVWFLFILKYWFIKVPRRMQERAEREAFTRYLPHKKT